MTSETVLIRLRDLEADCEAAGVALREAEAEHATAFRTSIMSCDDATVARAEAAQQAVHALRAEHARLAAMTEECRQILADTVRAEREAAAEAARLEIEAGLTELADMAAQAEDMVTALLGTLATMREREGRLHILAKAHFGSPLLAPRALEALELLGDYFRVLPGGNPPNRKPWIVQTITAAIRNIRGAYNAI